jgi:hypothetical protein
MAVALKDRVLAKIAELASTVMTEENINTNLVRQLFIIRLFFNTV